MTENPSVASAAGEVREFRASDGSVLRYRQWSAKGVPCATVLAVHGIQSHSGWYAHSSRALSEAGIDVRFLDRRGSGLNHSERGHAPHAARLMDDVADFARMITGNQAADQARPPLLLLGLSWGARLAATVCGRDPGLFDGLILLYPGICTNVRPTAVQRGLLRLANSCGGGRIPIQIPLSPERFTAVPRWQDYIRDDPLAIRQVTISFLLASEQLARQSIEALEGLTLPRLVMLAGQDEIADVPQTRTLLSRIPCESLRVIEYPNARHTLEFEPERDRFVADMIDWIESVCQQP